MTNHTLHDHIYSFYEMNLNMLTQIYFIIHYLIILTFNKHKSIKKALYHLDN